MRKRVWKYLFVFTVLLLIAFTINLIRFNNLRNQYIAEHGYNVTEHYDSMMSVGDEELIALNQKIIYQEMLVSALGFIVIVTIFFFVLNNHSMLIDRWRKFRGVKYKSLMVSELKNSN